MMSDFKTKISRWFAVKKWRRSTSLSDGEIAILKILIPCSDHRRNKLLSQAMDAPEIKRSLLGKNCCQVVIPYVKDVRYLIEANRDFISPPVTITDALSGRKLTFTVNVLRGGFLNHLTGKADDGDAWPIEWAIDFQQEALLSKQIKNWLPTILSKKERFRVINLLSEWVGINSEKLISFDENLLVINGPTNESEIHNAENRLKCQLPQQYREFVQICNGLSILHGRPYDIFGTQDLYLVENDWCVDPAVAITDLYESGMVTLSCGGDYSGMLQLFKSNTTEPEIVGDLRTHVKESIEWLEILSSARTETPVF